MGGLEGGRANWREVKLEGGLAGGRASWREGGLAGGREV